MKQCTEEQFRKDVANHTMKVLLDDGSHRHLRFSDGTFNMYFEIVTWPGNLVVSGDMGCFVFARIEDMFEFFRSDKLKINLEYWHEKLEAIKRHGGSTCYNPDLFIKRVNEYVQQFIEDEELNSEQAEELKDEVKEHVLYYADDSQEEARKAVHDFEYMIEGSSLDFKFYDTWEWDLEDYTYHYIWACYAIVWAIQQYDVVKGGLCVIT
jgi:hypothetical protein